MDADRMESERKQYPEGYFAGLGLAVGMLAGIPFSFFLGNPDLFVLGLPAGLAVGAAIEMKYKREGRIRPHSPEEAKRRTIMVIALVALVIVGVVVFLWFA